MAPILKGNSAAKLTITLLLFLIQSEGFRQEPRFSRSRPSGRSPADFNQQQQHRQPYLKGNAQLSRLSLQEEAAILQQTRRGQNEIRNKGLGNNSPVLRNANNRQRNPPQARELPNSRPFNNEGINRPKRLFGGQHNLQLNPPKHQLNDYDYDIDAFGENAGLGSRSSGEFNHFEDLNSVERPPSVRKPPQLRNLALKNANERSPGGGRRRPRQPQRDGGVGGGGGSAEFRHFQDLEDYPPPRLGRNKGYGHRGYGGPQQRPLRNRHHRNRHRPRHPPPPPPPHPPSPPPPSPSQQFPPDYSDYDNGAPFNSFEDYDSNPVYGPGDNALLAPYPDYSPGLTEEEDFNPSDYLPAGPQPTPPPPLPASPTPKRIPYAKSSFESGFNPPRGFQPEAFNSPYKPQGFKREPAVRPPRNIPYKAPDYESFDYDDRDSQFFSPPPASRKPARSVLPAVPKTLTGHFPDQRKQALVTMAPEKKDYQNTGFIHNQHGTFTNQVLTEFIPLSNWGTYRQRFTQLVDNNVDANVPFDQQHHQQRHNRPQRDYNPDDYFRNRQSNEVEPLQPDNRRAEIPLPPPLPHKTRSRQQRPPTAQQNAFENFSGSPLSKEFNYLSRSRGFF